MKSKLVSIVIPVYNEEEFLDECLRAISLQTVFPLEVLVIDNNSTDRSIEIVKSYPFVRLIRESNQGVVYARNRGFDEAQGTIIARIDADTRIDERWIENLERIFLNKNISAVTGSVYYYDIFSKYLSYKFDLFFRKDLVRRLDKNCFLLGANMAITKKAWLKIKDQTCIKSNIHEDLDLAIHLNKANLAVRFDKALRVGLSSRRYDSGYRSFVKYMFITPLTYRAHRDKNEYKFYSTVGVLILSYWIILFSHLIYDSKNSKISLKNIFHNQNTKRSDPYKL